MFKNKMFEVTKMLKIGIIGGGFVGKATAGFQNSKNIVKIYDLKPELRLPEDTTMEDMYHSQIVFVCVPTPMSNDGSCHTNIVELVVKDLQDHQVEHIVVRSTVPVNFSQNLGVHFMPEFLTEKNALFDFANCHSWIIGTNDDKNSSKFKRIMLDVIRTCYQQDIIVSPNVIFVTTSEAELVKYTRNCFLSTKVAFCNEIYKFCEKLGIDYDIVRHAFSVDPRIGESHTSVPGHDGKFGFGGTCFPKDTSSLIRQFKNHGVEAPVLSAVMHRNLTIDRPEQDWTLDQGRAVI
jgi:UDPglucose 6-dehydrogenase